MLGSAEESGGYRVILGMEGRAIMLDGRVRLGGELGVIWMELEALVSVGRKRRENWFR